MSALEKLAVAREVGTSRSAAAAAAPTSVGSRCASRDPGCQEEQKELPALHPLLHDLKSTQPIITCGKAAVAQFVKRGPDNHSSASQVKPPNNEACWSAGSTSAATALAKTLQHNHHMLLGSNPAQQLLQSVAATQQQQHPKQVKQTATNHAATVRPCHAAIVSIASPGTACNDRQTSAHGTSWQQTSTSIRVDYKTLHQALAAAAAVAAAAGTAPAVPAKRPVTPLVSKPYKPGSIRIQTAGSVRQGSPSVAVVDLMKGLSSKSTSTCRPRTAAPLAAGASSNDTQPAEMAAPAVRPGTAAAFKILRSLNHQSSAPDAVNRHGVANGCLSSKTILKPAAVQLMRQQTQDCELQQQQQVASCQVQNGQALLQQQQQECSAARPAADSLSCPAPAEQCSAQPKQKQPQREQGTWSAGRPSTAAMRALLASSQCKDGVEERLEHYRKLNSMHDNSEGLDIVHENEDESEGVVPDWLATTSYDACQATPMVLNLEDIVQSTAEVLELEIEQQLDELDVLQLQGLKAILLEQT